ncbi:acyltransferase family protein [Knoellia sp. CPCC 206450]|uniref:acyltransferase family protein n=1 Tax=Knoellia tibetensis TaxID=3404798 RepID=UPI003B42B2CB
MALDLTTGVGESERERPARHTPPGPLPRPDERAPTDGTRRPDIQGLRAVAVLLVVAFHAGLPLPGGFVGVDVFFVISGFVITGMLLREWRAHGRIRFARFYLRRVRRLTPALALMVSVTLLLSTLLLSPLGPQQATAQTAAGAMFVVANAVIARTTGGYFDGPAEQNALLHTWSLSVEEQFYLGFPLLLALSLLATRRRGARRLPALVVVVVSTCSLLVAVVVSRGWRLEVGELLVGFYGPLTRVWEFGAGALLALSPGLLALRTRGRARVAGVVGAVLLLASVVLISERTPFPGPWTLLPVVATMLLLRAGGVPGTATSRALRAAPMVRVGDWSYSVYLWHWPFIVFATALWPLWAAAAPVAAVLSFGAAVVSFRLVEDPVRRWQPPNRAGVVWLVAACLGPPVLLAGVLGVAVSQGFWSSTVRAHQAAVLEPHVGCYGYVPMTDASSARCTVHVADGVPVYLVGDSHAQHLTEAVRGAGRSSGRPVTVSTATNCPVLDIAVSKVGGPPGHDTGCRRFVQGTLRFLDGAPPGLVVLAASDRYWTDPGFAAGPVGGTVSTDPEVKLRVATTGLASTVRTLQGSGHSVILVADVPRWDGADSWTPVDCTVVSLVLAVGSCEREMPLSHVEARQGEFAEVLREVGRTTGAEVLDVTATLCPDGWCSNRMDGVTAYRDTNHLTVARSEALAPQFAAALTSSGGG